MQASKLLGQLIDAQWLLEVRVARHVSVIIAGISVRQIARMMCLRADQCIGGIPLRAAAIVNELHLVRIALLPAAEHNVDVVAAARQVDVAGRQWLRRGLHPRGVLIEIRLLAGAGAVIATLVTLETLSSITGGSVCGVGIVVVGRTSLLEIVLVLELECIARLEGIVLGIVEHIAHIRITLGQILMYILAGYLQILIQIRVALYIVVATVVECLTLLILMEQHCRGLLELTVIVAATTLASSCRSTWPIIVDGALPSAAAGVLRVAATAGCSGGRCQLATRLHLRLGHVPRIKFLWLLRCLSNSTHSALDLQFCWRLAIGKEAPAYGRRRTGIFGQLLIAQRSLRALPLQRGTTRRRQRQLALFVLRRVSELLGSIEDGGQ